MRGSPARDHRAGVAHEQGQHPPFRAGGGQRRMVPQSQVPPEPHHRGRQYLNLLVTKLASSCEDSVLNHFLVPPAGRGWGREGTDAITNELLTLHEAADRIGVHYMTVYRYVRTGRLPAARLGGTWRVQAPDLEALSSAGTGAAPRGSGLSRARSQLLKRLIAGDEAGAWELVERSLSSGTAPEMALVGLIGGGPRRDRSGVVDRRAVCGRRTPGQRGCYPPGQPARGPFPTAWAQARHGRTGRPGRRAARPPLSRWRPTYCAGTASPWWTWVRTHPPTLSPKPPA